MTRKNAPTYPLRYHVKDVITETCDEIKDGHKRWKNLDGNLKKVVVGIAMSVPSFALLTAGAFGYASQSDDVATCEDPSFVQHSSPGVAETRQDFCDAVASDRNFAEGLILVGGLGQVAALGFVADGASRYRRNNGKDITPTHSARRSGMTR
jgi:hypothetical protein